MISRRAKALQLHYERTFENHRNFLENRIKGLSTFQSLRCQLRLFCRNPLPELPPVFVQAVTRVDLTGTAAFLLRYAFSPNGMENAAPPRDSPSLLSHIENLGNHLATVNTESIAAKLLEALQPDEPETVHLYGEHALKKFKQLYTRLTQKAHPQLATLFCISRMLADAAHGRLEGPLDSEVIEIAVRTFERLFYELSAEHPETLSTLKQALSAYQQVVLHAPPGSPSTPEELPALPIAPKADSGKRKPEIKPKEADRAKPETTKRSSRQKPVATSAVRLPATHSVSVPGCETNAPAAPASLLAEQLLRMKAHYPPLVRGSSRANSAIEGIRSLVYQKQSRVAVDSADVQTTSNPHTELPSSIQEAQQEWRQHGTNSRRHRRTLPPAKRPRR
eukprot:TRINITY_DN5936_c0_g1_i1.p1 TRINITY_DN5936_c0_g1~~TRINITY_DN5936_c0_g1_i1.p1  ORF type:complete len:455 (-),score=43.15 TRINITY_DN5936_c0_g1_i1:940-2115(-)